MSDAELFADEQGAPPVPNHVNQETNNDSANESRSGTADEMESDDDDEQDQQDGRGDDNDQVDQIVALF